LKTFVTIVHPDGSTEKLPVEALRIARLYARLMQYPAAAAAMAPGIAGMDAAEKMFACLDDVKAKAEASERAEIVSRN
jgi:hypothetical protein